MTGERLSTTERAAIAGFSEQSRIRAWCSSDDVERALAAYREQGGFELALRAPVEKVQAYLARALKPDRRLLSVAMTERGIVETWASDPTVLAPYREGEERPDDGKPEVPPKGEEGKVLDLAPRLPPKKAKTAVTVAKPVNGCPAPDFAESADARACRVLEAFLTPQQKSDWRQFGGFVSIGRDSGDRFMLCSRDSRTLLRQHGGRTLFNLDRGFAHCVHDWDVPPPEELLALHAFLSVPGGETILTRLRA